MRVFSVVAIALAVALPGVPRQVAFVDPALSGDAIVSVASGQADRVAAFARGAGAADVRSLGALNLVTAHLDAAATRSLAANVAVTAIDADANISAADSGDEADLPRGEGGDDEVGKRFREWEDGRAPSVAVAVVDSGVADSPDLAGRVVARVDFVNDGVTSYDPGGHGTFIAGLIAGTTTGVDPSAKIVSLRVLNERGIGKSRNALAAFDWLLRHRVAYGIRVVNLSWGAPQRTTYHRDVLAAAAESLWFAGMTVVVAAGNDGPRPFTINTPGADPFVITVGSINQKGTASTSDDRESRWSSRGPTLDNFTKPDLLAPGENVVSLRAAGSFLDSRDEGRAVPVSPQFMTMSGTSVSSAIVSGTAALLIARDPWITPTLVKTALVSTATKVQDSTTRELDPRKALSFKPERRTPSANRGLRPSQLLLRVVAATLGGANITWENLTWESITWETITWENITWESLTWETLTWETLSWETLKE